MIGTKFYKEDLIQTEYREAAEWCNTTQLGIIEDKGEYYEVVAVPEVSLEELKNKIELIKKKLSICLLSYLTNCVKE